MASEKPLGSGPGPGQAKVRGLAVAAPTEGLDCVHLGPIQDKNCHCLSHETHHELDHELGDHGVHDDFDHDSDLMNRQTTGLGKPLKYESSDPMYVLNLANLKAAAAT